MSTVFISYAFEDREIAEDLYHALERAGHTAFLDKKALPIGQEYNVHIEDLVSKSDYFVFLISPDAIQSGTYALTELQYAEAKWGKEPEGIVPVMIRPVDTKALPSFLRQTTYLSPKGNATAEVLSELNRRSQTGGREEAIRRSDRSARAQEHFTLELHNRLEFYKDVGSTTRMNVLSCFRSQPLCVLSPSSSYSTVSLGLMPRFVYLLRVSLP